MKTWFITGVNSGFGLEMTKILLEKGEKVIGTVRNKDKVKELLENYPNNFFCEELDLSFGEDIVKVVDSSFEKYGKIDVLVSNAGYGLFGTAEELSYTEIDEIILANLTGSIKLIKAFIPYFRKQKDGRIIQMSSYGGQVAFASNSLYHATKFGIEGFCESISKELEPFNIGVTIVEPGGARTEFRYGSAKVATLMPEYEHAHAFLDMLDSTKGLAPGDPKLMALRIIESTYSKAPLRLLLGSQAYETTVNTLKERIKDYENQKDIAYSTDFK